MSGTAQYIRKASLIIGDDDTAIDVSQLRFKFFIRRGDIQTPNTADIRVYNLAPNTAKKIEKEFTRLILQGGYEGSFGVLFDGTIKQVRRGREQQTETYLDITAADGDEAYNYSVTALSLAAGQTSPKTQIESIIKGMAVHGVKKGYVPDSVSAQPLPRGKAIYGMSRDVLRRQSENVGSSWSIQDGKVDVVPLTAYTPAAEIPVISALSGMIGQPEQTSNGIRIKALINPLFRVGQVIKIDNKSILQQRYSTATGQQAQNFYSQLSAKLDDDGYYYVMVAEHYGDTRGNAWYTDMICLAVDSTAIPFGLVGKVPVDQSAIPAIKRNP